MKFTYLLIDFFAIIFPFLFSFHPKLAFVKVWPAFFPAVVISSAFFIVGDIIFTNLKIWGFNHKYVLGYYFMNLPIEEILFFFCIPYACVFTYHCLNVLYFKNRTLISDRFFTIFFIIALLLLAIVHHDKPYTFFAFSVLVTLLAVTKFLLKAVWLTRFYLTFIVLLLPFFIVNGLLTGTGLNEPVVWYANSTYMGWKLLTIPVEDVFYGMSLVLMNVIILSSIQAKKKYF